MNTISRRRFLGGALGLGGALALGGQGIALGETLERQSAAGEYRGIPLRLMTLFTPPEIVSGNSLDIAGGVCYVANRAADFIAAVDIRNPGQPRVISTLKFDGQRSASSVTVCRGLAVTTDASANALGTIDVSDPANPRSLGSVASTTALTGAWHVQVKGGYAYVACRGSNANGSLEDGVFTVVDISDPARPQIAAVVQDEFTPEPRHVQVRGRYLYLADEHRAGDFTGQGSFQVFDVSTPTNPIRVAYLATPELLDARKSALSGRIAIVCGRDNPDARIVSIDISDPRNPVQLDAEGAPDTRYTHGVTIAGTYAYMASVVDDSVSAWDISDPTNLRLAALLKAPELDEASEIVAHRRHLFVFARGRGGLAVLG